MRSFGHEDAAQADPESLGAVIKNHNIRDFLETNGKRYIVGPKGSGKTLLLLKKAIEQRRGGDGICVPGEPHTPVDKFTGAVHSGRQFDRRFTDTSDHHLAWTSVWKNAIYRAIIHQVRDDILLATKPKDNLASRDSWEESVDRQKFVQARTLINDAIIDDSPIVQTPYDYFMEVCSWLDDSRQRGLDQLRHDNRRFSGLIKLLRMPIYVFLDNLDDYYETEPTLWFNSMYGQFRAVREISLEHLNLNVFTSIREDVYNQFDDEMRLQYYDYVCPLRYDRNELLSIFSAHITLLDDDLLEQPSLKETQPWRAFFGEATSISTNSHGPDEDVRDYIYRHTLGRPRDIIHIGTRLLNRLPREGRKVRVVRDTVFEASTDIARQYLAETKPLTDPRFDIEEFVREFFPADIVAKEDIGTLEENYVRKVREKSFYERGEISDIAQPFATMYELGLLGRIDKDHATDELIQLFERPGQAGTTGRERELPDSSQYLLHPILTNLIIPDRKRRGAIIGNQHPAELLVTSAES